MSDTTPPDAGGAQSRPGYTPPPPYGQQPPVYGQNPGYGQHSGYAQQPGYPPGYAQPSPYGQAPGYAQPYGVVPGYGYPAPPKTNTLAIVSLVSSIAGIVILYGIGSIAGVITGHLAISQIKRTNEGGRGLAIAGLIIGYVGVAFTAFLLIILFAIWGTAVSYSGY